MTSPSWWLPGLTVDEVASQVVGMPLHEAEYRLHCADLQTRLRRVIDTTDHGPSTGHNAQRVNLTVTRQLKVVGFEIG